MSSNEINDEIERLRFQQAALLRSLDTYTQRLRDQAGELEAVREELEEHQQKEQARLRADEEMQLTERRLNLALDSTQMGAWDLDLLNDRTWRSLRHDRVFGYDSLLPEWGYNTFLTHVLPEDLEKVKKNFAEAFETDYFNMECRIRWPDESVHWISSQGHLYRNENGDPIRMMGLVTNIDARKQMEQILEQRIQELGHSNTELQQFVYIASHDLQEPLRKVQAFGDLLVARSAEALGEEGRDYLNRMQAAAQHMQGLINDLLSYSRVTSRGKPFVSFELGRVARKVVSDLEYQIKSKGGRVEVGEMPRVDGDPHQMSQLLQNLIGNALKFHRRDVPPEVAVQGRIVKNGNGAFLQHSPSDLLCEITVQDFGVGFEEKYLDKIFAPFQRLHGRGEYEGTGMGLAVCRKIAERHGGTITARSTPGAGSTFIVTLPLRQGRGELRHA